MNSTGEQLRRVNQIASAILALVILAVLAGILWMSGMEGKPQAPGLQDPMQGNPPAASPEGAPEISLPNRTGSDAAFPGEPGPSATPSATVRAIPAPPPGQLDYLPPDSVSSPEPRSERAGEFDT
jgi:hypothetical protein